MKTPPDVAAIPSWCVLFSIQGLKRACLKFFSPAYAPRPHAWHLAQEYVGRFFIALIYAEERSFQGKKRARRNFERDIFLNRGSFCFPCGHDTLRQDIKFSHDFSVCGPSIPRHPWSGPYLRMAQSFSVSVCVGYLVFEGKGRGREGHVVAFSKTRWRHDGVTEISPEGSDSVAKAHKPGLWRTKRRGNEKQMKVFWML
jgi:hypothetical protein